MQGFCASRKKRKGRLAHCMTADVDLITMRNAARHSRRQIEACERLAKEPQYQAFKRHVHPLKSSIPSSIPCSPEVPREGSHTGAASSGQPQA